MIKTYELNNSKALLPGIEYDGSNIGELVEFAGDTGFRIAETYDNPHFEIVAYGMQHVTGPDGPEAQFYWVDIDPGMVVLRATQCGGEHKLLVSLPKDSVTEIG